MSMRLPGASSFDSFHIGSDPGDGSDFCDSLEQPSVPDGVRISGSENLVGAHISQSSSISVQASVACKGQLLPGGTTTIAISEKELPGTASMSPTDTGKAQLVAVARDSTGGADFAFSEKTGAGLSPDRMYALAKAVPVGGPTADATSVSSCGIAAGNILLADVPIDIGKELSHGGLGAEFHAAQRRCADARFSRSAIWPPDAGNANWEEGIALETASCEAKKLPTLWLSKPGCKVVADDGTCDGCGDGSPVVPSARGAGTVRHAKNHVSVNGSGQDDTQLSCTEVSPSGASAADGEHKDGLQPAAGAAVSFGL